MDKELLSILVCPVSKGPLEYSKANQELLCKASGLAYPIKEG
ncbi:MAG: Trm112 family protein, partial [Porticoccaceae bacterium]|nr:Trm112 family protein [Porticoccaceae bacterium]